MYYSQIEDFVGPLRVETPNVFLDPDHARHAYLSNPAFFGLSGAGEITALTDRAWQASHSARSAPDGRHWIPSDLILTYRNFGDVDLTGVDLAHPGPVQRHLVRPCCPTPT